MLLVGKDVANGGAAFDVDAYIHTVSSDPAFKKVAYWALFATSESQIPPSRMNGHLRAMAMLKAWTIEAGLFTEADFDSANDTNRDHYVVLSQLAAMLTFDGLHSLVPPVPFRGGVTSGSALNDIDRLSQLKRLVMTIGRLTPKGHTITAAELPTYLTYAVTMQEVEAILKKGGLAAQQIVDNTKDLTSLVKSVAETWGIEFKPTADLADAQTLDKDLAFAIAHEINQILAAVESDAELQHRGTACRTVSSMSASLSSCARKRCASNWKNYSARRCVRDTQTMQYTFYSWANSPTTWSATSMR